MTEGLRSSHTNFSLLFHLEGTQVGGLRLLMLCILSFFTLDSECLFVIRCFNALLVMNITDVCFGLCLNSSCSHILRYCHQTRIAFASFINLYYTNINTRYCNTKVLFQTFGDVKFNRIINLSYFVFQLHNRNVMSSRCVSYSILYVSTNSIADLPLEVIEGKCIEPIDFDKLSIIADLETDCTAYSNRHTKIQKARIKHIKEWYRKTNLDNASQINKVNFCLKRSSTLKS